MTGTKSRGTGPGGMEPQWYRAIDGMNHAFAIVGGMACFLLAVNVVVDVLGRSIFDAPIAGTLDVTTYVWMPTLVALGFGYSLLRNEHIRVTLITGSASAGAQRAAQVTSMAAVAVVAVAMAYYGAVVAMDAAALNESAVSAPWLIVWPFRFVVTVGLLGVAAQALVEGVRALTAQPHEASA